jgi:glycine cleavage system H protein
MNVIDSLKYTKDHEWVLVEGNRATIGITDYAQGELGDVVFVDINPDLKELKKGEPFGTIEAVKTVSDLYAPCSGKVVEINPDLNDSPELINSDPYGKGWMIKVEIENEDDLNELLSAEDYKGILN